MIVERMRGEARDKRSKRARSLAQTAPGEWLSDVTKSLQ